MACAMTRKEVKLHAKPWINQKIIMLIKYRDKLKKKMKRKPTVDNEHLYKKFRNRVANELKASRSVNHNRYFQTHKDYIRKLWSGIRSIINIKQNVDFQVSQLTVNNIEVTDLPKIASEFNTYFTNVPKQVDKGIPFTRKSPMDYLQNRVDNSF